MTDDNDIWRTADEPSPEEFEAAEQAEPPVGVKAVAFRVVRVAGVLLLIAALLLYFVMPFRVAFIRVLHEWRLPLQSIPLAPDHRSNPRLPA